MGEKREVVDEVTHQVFVGPFVSVEFPPGVVEFEIFFYPRLRGGEVFIGPHETTIVPLSLAINIQSMMEMDPPVTASYFDLMRGCPRRETAFYCCNNEEKRLPDGTASRFVDYPWRDGDKILVDEICPWLRYRYTDRPPFYVPRRVNLHRLVMLEKGDN